MPWAPEFRKAGREGHHRQRHRRRHRDRRLRARSRRSASTCPTTRRCARSTAASRCRSRTSTRPTTSRRCRSSAASSPGRPRKRRAPTSGARSPASCTTNMHEVIGHASGKVSDKVSGNPGRRAEGAVLGARGGPRRSRRPVLPAPIPKLAELGILQGRGPGRDRPGRVRGLHEERAGAAAPDPPGHADRGRPHAQPPDDRAVADGQHQGHRGAPARRQDLLRDDRRRGVPRGRRPAAGRGAAHQERRATTPPPRRCSRPTACTSTRSCATKSWRASTGCSCRRTRAS